MTTFSSSRRLLPGSGDDPHGEVPSRRIEGCRNLHRAEGWAIALTGAVTLWALVIGGVTHVASLLG